MAKFNFDESGDLNELAKEFERLASKEKQLEFIEESELPVNEQNDQKVRKVKSVPRKIVISVVGVVVVSLVLFFGLKMLGGFRGDNSEVYKTVPDVLKKDVTKARELLYKEGFRVKEIYDPTSNATPGEVILQNQPPGTKIRAGANIVLTVAGKAPRDSGKGTASSRVSAQNQYPPKSGQTDPSANNAIFVIIPNLEGLDPGQARQKLEALGLRTEELLINDDERQPGMIIGSDPGPDSSVEQGTLVKIKVSAASSSSPDVFDGNPVTIPDYFGQPSEDAIEDLKNNGLNPVWETEESSQLRPGIVIRTEPAAGSTVDSGAKVTVIVAR